MVQTDTKAQRLTKSFIFHSGKVQFKILVRHAHEATGIIFHSTVVDHVFGGQSCLSSRRDEHNHGLLGGVILDSKERWPVHRLHEGTETSLLREAIDEDFKGHRSHRMPKVEQPFLDPQPVCQVRGIGTGSGHTHKTNRTLRL